MGRWLVQEKMILFERMPDNYTQLYFKTFVQCIRQISASIQVSLEGRIEISGFLIYVA